MTKQLIIIFIFISTIVWSQTVKRKLILINEVDTFFYHQHIGFTSFTNYIDTIKDNINYSEYIEKSLLNTIRADKYFNVVKVILKTSKKTLTYNKETKEKLKYIRDTSGAELAIIVEFPHVQDLIRNSIYYDGYGVISDFKRVTAYTNIYYRLISLKDMKSHSCSFDYSSQWKDIKDFKIPEKGCAISKDSINIIKENILNITDIVNTRFIMDVNIRNILKGISQ